MRKLSNSAFYKIVFVLSLFALVFISSMSYKQLEMQNDSEARLRLSDRINLELEELASHVKDAETGQRGFIITRDSIYLQPYHDANVHIKGSYKELNYLLKNDPLQKAKLERLKHLISERLTVMDQTLVRSLDEPAIISDSLRQELRRGNRLMYEIRAQADTMIRLENELLAARNSEHNNHRIFTPMALLLISFFSLLVFIASFVKINRDRKQLSQLNEEATQAKIAFETERLYRKLIEGLPAALYTCDKQGYVQLYNPAAVDLWGRELVPGKDLWYAPWKIYRADGAPLPSEECPVLMIMNGEEVSNKEIIIELEDGRRRHVIPHPQRLYDSNGNITGALNMMVDITEQKKSQKELEESEIRLRIATEGTKLATWDLNLHTREIIYSPRLNEIFGHASSHVLTHPQMRAQIHKSDLHIVEAAFEQAQTEGVYFYEARVVKPDGSISRIRTEGKTLFNGEGQPLRILGTLMDITDQYEAQEKLQRSEKLFKSIALNIPNTLILVFDRDYKVLTLEGDIMQKMGYSPDDYEGKYLYDLGPIERHEEALPLYDRVFSGEKFSVERKSHETGDDFMVHFVPMKTDDDEVYAALVIALDITEYRKTHDKTLMLGAIVESSEDAIVSKTLEGIVTSWNKAAERIFGYTEEEMVGQPITMIIPPERLQEEPRILSQLKKGNRVDHFETVRRTKDGRLIDISLTLSPIKDETGKIIGASKIARDVTEQKKVDGLLKESEERFRTLTDVVPVLVWISDTKQQRNFFNKGWLDFTGKTMVEELNNGWLEGIHPDDLERYQEHFAAAFEVREEFYLEYRLKCHDGEYRWISDKGIPRFSTDNAFIGYIGGCMDISDQKDFTIELERQVIERTDELAGRNFELQQQKEFAETILDTSIDVTIVYDTQMNFLSFNKAAERKYAVTKDEILGQNLLTFYPEVIDSKGHRDLERAIAGEMIHNARYRSPVTNLYYEDFLIPLLNRNGDVYAVLVIARDITDTVRNEELLMHLNESLVAKNTELERSNTELASFNHVASHDLQEPLRKIQTFISRIMDIDDTGLTEKTSEYFTKIRSSANRMQTLIDDLLTFSRTNKPDQQRETVDLNTVIDLVQRELSQTIEEKEAVIVSEPLPTIEGIAFQFQQLFINLIGNALKYSKPDVPPLVQVGCSVVTAGDYVFLNAPGDKPFYKITISDNGIGFDQQYASQIFELFQRLHGKMDYTGTGIGLTICKKIVENHQGYIMAEGTPGVGSVFTVFLPV
jgi:PAS domain S-box-containing protein